MQGPDNSTSHTSDKYDRDVRKTIPHYDTIHGEVLRFIRVRLSRPRSWLDTGCGTGMFVKKAPDIFPDTEFFVTDPSRAMLGQAEMNLRGCRYSLPGARATADLPGITDQRFDVITAPRCHHYLTREGRVEAVRACHALLADGGIFITSENIRPFSREGKESGLAYWGAFQRDAGRDDAEVEKHLARFDHEYFPIPVTDDLMIFKDAGFSVAEILWFSYMQAVFWCKR